jgi:2-desacetyl-2-hydroxyethyl bacteriochlorophyllide A dehydrogenase
MRAALWTADGTLEIADRPQPEPRAGWVRVRVASVGICGTDLHFFDGSFPSPKGLLPGHEVGGTIDAVGQGVTLTIGTPVAVEPLAGCGTCAHCLIGNDNRCSARTLFGVTARGGMAEFMTIPANRVYALGDGLDPADGALAEPVAVCVRGVRLAGVGAGDRVAVLGAGTIGLVSCLAAVAAGAAEVFVSARHPFQKALAASFGARELDSSEVGTFDVVIETVGGLADTLGQATRLTKPGGVIALLGVFSTPVPFDAYDVCIRELRVVGSNCYGHGGTRRDFEVAVELLAAHRDALRTLVTHRFPLESVNDAFACASDKSTGSIKVQVTP